MAVIASILSYEFWVDGLGGRTKRVFHDVERARAFRDRTPGADSGTTVVDQEITTTTGTTQHGYERPGLHATP